MSLEEDPPLLRAAIFALTRDANIVEKEADRAWLIRC